MNVAILGGFGKRMLAPGWTRERAVAVFGGGELDLSGAMPGENAHLTAIAIFGGIDITVDEQCQVTMTGFNLFGSREVDVISTDGPSITIRGIAIFGGVEVKNPKSN